MKTLLIAALAAAGLMTCACTSQHSAAAPAGAAAAVKASQPATPRKLVTLAPGGVANALLRIVAAGNYPAAKCGPVTALWLQIFPPNQTVPVYLYYTAPACTRPVPLLTVNTVAPGSGG